MIVTNNTKQAQFFNDSVTLKPGKNTLTDTQLVNLTVSKPVKNTKGTIIRDENAWFNKLVKDGLIVISADTTQQVVPAEKPSAPLE